MTATHPTHIAIADSSDDLDEFLNERLQDPAFAGLYRDAQARTELRLQLINLRKRSGLNQTQVAAAMHTTQSSVSVFENGDGEPYLSTMQRYARAIGAEVEIRLAEHPAL